MSLVLIFQFRNSSLHFFLLKVLLVAEKATFELSLRLFLDLLQVVIHNCILLFFERFKWSKEKILILVKVHLLRCYQAGADREVSHKRTQIKLILDRAWIFEFLKYLCVFECFLQLLCGYETFVEARSVLLDSSLKIQDIHLAQSLIGGASRTIIGVRIKILTVNRNISVARIAWRDSHF